MITRQLVRVATGSSDDEGCLLYANGTLVAMLVKLSDPTHGKLLGTWFTEWGFGNSYPRGKAPVFDNIDAAERWLGEMLAEWSST